jgi:hypothetical protein
MSSLDLSFPAEWGFRKRLSNGSSVVGKRVMSKGPGREAGPILAGPCHNVKGANDFQEQFDPADEQDVFPSLSPSLPNCNARKGLNDCEKMEHKRQRPGMRAASQRCLVTAF